MDSKKLPPPHELAGDIVKSVERQAKQIAAMLTMTKEEAAWLDDLGRKLEAAKTDAEREDIERRFRLAAVESMLRKSKP